MTFRLIADCRLTANSPPTEISESPYKIWVLDKNSVGSCHLNFCSFRLKISKAFQAFASVGKSAISPYSYGVTLMPPALSGGDQLSILTIHIPSAKGKSHARS